MLTNNLVSVEIAVENTLWDGYELENRITRIVNLCAAHERLENHCIVSVVLADNTLVQSLNAQYRGQNKPTDVLSFPAYDEADDIPEGETIGDILLSYEKIKADAENQGKGFEDHLTHLIVHGFLHLLGYDHQSPEEAEEMEQKEITILNELGVQNPYEI